VDALIQKLVDLVTQANGKILYADILPQLDFAETQLLPRAIDMVRANGTLKRRAVWNAETKKTEVFIELPAQEG
jgi:hypothetical protein